MDLVSSRVFVKDTELRDIADAIREKNGTEDKYKPSEMGDAVRAIQSGGGEIPANAAIVFEYHTDGDNVGEIKSIRVNKGTETPQYMFSDNKVPNKYYNYVESVYFADTITKLGQMTCGRFASLKNVRLPQNILTIESAAFTQAPIEKLELPQTLTSIGSYCFEGSRFKDLLIYEQITSIGNCAFQANGLLEKVRFKCILSTLGSEMFKSCSALSDIYVPWSEGEVANAPWGAANATIHYNTTYDENHNPIV